MIDLNKMRKNRMSENQKLFVIANQKTMSYDQIAWKLEKPKSTIYSFLENI